MVPGHLVGARHRNGGHVGVFLGAAVEGEDQRLHDGLTQPDAHLVAPLVQILRKDAQPVQRFCGCQAVGRAKPIGLLCVLFGWW